MQESTQDSASAKESAALTLCSHIESSQLIYFPLNLYTIALTGTSSNRNIHLEVEPTSANLSHQGQVFKTRSVTASLY